METAGKCYRINEIFYSLQGEGRHAGRAAVFVRFSGCNLKCPFCDTDFADFQPMTARQIVAAIAPWAHCRFVVLTGGEPSLQADQALVDLLHEAGFTVAMETNGTHPTPQGIDWVTVSPKSDFVDHALPIVARQIDEVKVVFDGRHDPAAYAGLGDHPYLCLQPCDTGNDEQNRRLTAQCVDYVKKNPQWHLSLQIHKLIDIQ